MIVSDAITRWFAERGFDKQSPNSANAKGQLALILAAQQGRADAISYLLDAGADLDVIDPYGNNALWAACFIESKACIDLLLAAGIAIDYQNPSGATALIYASSSGRHEIVEHLLRAGADPLLATQDDFTALDLASTRECLKLLRNAKRVKQSGSVP